MDLDTNKRKLTTALLFSALSMGVLSAADDGNSEPAKDEIEKPTIVIESDVVDNQTAKESDANESASSAPSPKKVTFYNAPLIPTSPCYKNTDQDEDMFSVSGYVNSRSLIVSKPLQSMMTHKESAIFEYFANNGSYVLDAYMFGTGEDEQPRPRAEFLAILKLWSDRANEIDPSKSIKVDSSKLHSLDQKILKGQKKVNFDFELINSVAKYLKCSVLFLNVGHNLFGCIDILKEMVYVKYDEEQNESAAHLVKKSRTSDANLFKLLPVENENTLVMCYNSDLKRFLFSLPYKDDVSVLGLEQIKDLNKIERKIVKMNHIRYIKNKALVAIPSVIGLSSIGYICSKYCPNLLNYCKDFFKSFGEKFSKTISK